MYMDSLPASIVIMATESHRLVFSINSGRSGSQYLARLLGTANGVCAFHEAEPDMSGLFLQMVCQQGLKETFAARSIKAQAIEHIIGQLPAGTLYAETNHMFIKTYFDVILQYFGEHIVEVIRLRRRLPDVLKSFINMGYFSDRNRVWPAWMHIPGRCDSAFNPPPLQRQPDQFDLAIGYLLDIEARAERFRAHYPDCKVHEVRLESLQTPEEVDSFFAVIGLSTTPTTLEMIGKPANERTQRKAQIAMPTTAEYCEERIRDYIHSCRASGCSLPSGLEAAI